MNYKKQAIECVSGYILSAQKRRFEECNKDFDMFYGQESDDLYSYAVIIPGKEYELSYHRCTCARVYNENITDPKYCECSRQSILYILEQLDTGKEFSVEIIDSVLRGGSRCRFRIIVRDKGDRDEFKL